MDNLLNVLPPSAKEKTPSEEEYKEAITSIDTSKVNDEWRKNKKCESNPKLSESNGKEGKTIFLWLLSLVPILNWFTFKWKVCKMIVEWEEQHDTKTMRQMRKDT